MTDRFQICPHCLKRQRHLTCTEDQTPTLPVEHSIDPLLGQVIDGRYIVLSHHGQGGTARVYRAWQRTTGRMVAIKALTRHIGRPPADHTVRRFEREIHVLSQLRSPHTVTVLDSGRLQDGHPYLVMELLRGETLTRFIERVGPLPEPLTRSLMSQICLSVEEAHTMDTLHRDLKPDNIIIQCINEGVYHAHVLDFGLVKSSSDASEAITLRGTILGTPAYMSPEQLLGGEVTATADVFAAGVLLFEMVTGRRMFNESSAPALFRQRLSLAERQASPLTLHPDLDPHCWALPLVARCVAGSPQRRPGSLRWLRRALSAGEVVRQPLVGVSPPGTPPRSRARTLASTRSVH